MLNFFFLKYLTYTITSFMNQWGKKIQQYISINKVTFKFSKKKKKKKKQLKTPYGKRFWKTIKLRV